MESIKLPKEKTDQLVKQKLIEEYSCSSNMEIETFQDENKRVSYWINETILWKGKEVKRIQPLSFYMYRILLKERLEEKGYDVSYIGVSRGQDFYYEVVAKIYEIAGFQKKKGGHKYE